MNATRHFQSLEDLIFLSLVLKMYCVVPFYSEAYLKTGVERHFSSRHYTADYWTRTLVLGSFDNENFWHQKHQLNANKYLFQNIFVNRGAKLYAIMQKITKSFNPVFKQISKNM